MTNQSMVDINSIQNWLHHLYILSPASAVLLIGAGSSNSAWIRLLQKVSAKNITLVEANLKKIRLLTPLLDEQTSWHINHALITQKAENTRFYQTNYEAENGLSKPEELQKIWPNIALVDAEERSSTTLNALQKALKTPASWLIIDCLSALDILKGGTAALKNIDVIVIRHLITEVTPELDKHSNQEHIFAYMGEHNYRRIATEPENNPVIGHTLYIKKKKENEKEHQLSEEKKTLNKQLIETTQKLTETENKQYHINEEFIKVEAQIELIKDMLLHEKTHDN